MTNAIAFPRFNDLGRMVTPTFHSRKRFYLQLFLQCPKMNKKSMWEVKKKLTVFVHETSNPAILQLQGA